MKLFCCFPWKTQLRCYFFGVTIKPMASNKTKVTSFSTHKPGATVTPLCQMTAWSRPENVAAKNSFTKHITRALKSFS